MTDNKMLVAVAAISIVIGILFGYIAGNEEKSHKKPAHAIPGIVSSETAALTLDELVAKNANLTLENKGMKEQLAELNASNMIQLGELEGLKTIFQDYENILRESEEIKAIDFQLKARIEELEYKVRGYKLILEKISTLSTRSDIELRDAQQQMHKNSDSAIEFSNDNVTAPVAVQEDSSRNLKK
ncbi:MAG: hypothetical protein ISR96_07725 [Nitrospira sp.]|nr:hypothetical protein [bacterium]MBL7049386.1 hypothetical protein [Nitrospira sp.]